MGASEIYGKINMFQTTNQFTIWLLNIAMENP